MYAALMTTASLFAASRVFGIASGAGLVLAIASLGVAFAAARSDGRFDRPVMAFLGLSVALWTFSIGGQLYQRYVPTSDEIRILIDPLALSVAVAADAFVIVAALSLRAAMRSGKTP